MLEVESSYGDRVEHSGKVGVKTRPTKTKNI